MSETGKTTCKKPKLPKHVRTFQVNEVLRLVADGMKVYAACGRVGISLSTFNRYAKPIRGEEA